MGREVDKLLKVKEISQVERDTNELYFVLENDEKRAQLSPSNKMLTDSDAMAFVYLFEEDDQYVAIHFPQAVWPMMLEAFQYNEDPMLKWGNDIIRLQGFKEELTMLLYNIEGNHNYGEAFSTAVEQAFQSFYQEQL